MHEAAYYELVGENFKKNPRYPDIPALRKTHARAFSLPQCEPPKSHYDYIGNDSIARLLNHPKNYSDFLSRQLRLS